jgi:hypothetical protein
MNTQYYKVMPIDVLPEEHDLYFVMNEDGLKFESWYHPDLDVWESSDAFFNERVVHWLKPITLTLHELLSTEEGKEIVREVFNAAREENPTEFVRYSHDTTLIVHTGGQKTKYPTAQDYIDSLKPTQS